MADELTEYLESLNRDACFRVDAVLKESDFETTQRVYFVGENGAEAGPFVRKRFPAKAGFGSAYDRIFSEQRSGRRFLFLPRIVDCYDMDNDHVVVMEYVAGMTLDEFVRSRRPSLELATQIFPLLCDAVSELHETFELPIIHRDLKPSNAIVTPGANAPSLTIIDFGIARTYHDGAEEDTRHFGTRAWAPPEQFGFRQTDVRSDVYALGLLLYFCLTGKTPDAGAQKHAYHDPAYPETVRRIIVKATAFDPENRYASARELQSAFLEALAANAADGTYGNSRFAMNASTRGESPSTLDSKMQISAKGEPHATQEEAQTTIGGKTKDAQPSSPRGASSSLAQSATPEKLPSEPDATQADAKPQRSRTSIVFSFFRNVAVIIAFLAFFAACTDLIANPRPGDFGAEMPLGTRIRGYYGILFLILGPCLYLVADRRPLKERFPAFAKVSTLREVIVCIVLMVIGFIVVGTA